MKINFTFNFKIMMLFLKQVGGANKKGLCVSCEKNVAALKGWQSPSDKQTNQQTNSDWSWRNLCWESWSRESWVERVGDKLWKKGRFSILSFQSFILWASQVALVVKNSPANAGDVRDMGSISRSKRSPVFLPRESHGQRSLVGYSPWGHKESDTTAVT